MNFSLSTVINTTLAASFLICMIALLMSKRRFMKYVSFSTFLLVCTVVTTRLLFPYEFSFTKNINIRHLWGPLYSFLYRDFYAGTVRFEMLYILIILWILGVFYFLSGKIINYYRVRKTVHSLPPVTDPCILSVVQQINAGYSRPAPILLASSAPSSPPCIMGCFWPVMILPDITLSRKEWNYIISHELAHYYHRHLHLKWILELLSAVYFWNPFILILKKQANRLMEFIADAKVAQSLTPLEKIEYAECLTKITRLYHESRIKSQCGITFAAIRPGLSQRVEMILESSDDSVSKKHNIFFTGLICLFIAISYLFILEPSLEAPQNITNFSLSPDETYYRPNPDGSYDVICNGVYIITVTVIFDENIPIKEE